jgi:hypothetical protein
MVSDYDAQVEEQQVSWVSCCVFPISPATQANPSFISLVTTFVERARARNGLETTSAQIPESLPGKGNRPQRRKLHQKERKRVQEEEEKESQMWEGLLYGFYWFSSGEWRMFQSFFE